MRTPFFLWPNRKPATALVDPVAFGIAFLAGPIIPGIVGAPLFFVPTVAVVLGALPWLFVGAPLFWRAIRTGMTETRDFVRLGFIINFAGGCLLFIPLVAWTFASPDILRMQDTFTLFVTMWILACLHGPIWSSVFAEAYRKFRNPNFPQLV